MLISKIIEFDAGHRIPKHGGKCRNPHGHRYKVKVTVEGHLIEGHGKSDEGMVLDFSSLKSVMTDYIHDVFDHGFIVYKGDKALLSGLQASPEEIEHNGEWKIIVVPYIPTAENLAIAIWAAIEKVGIKGLREVRVWETPTCEAVYHGQYKEREVQAIAAPE